MEQSPAYLAAVVLNPEHKLDYFKLNWEANPQLIAEAERIVEDLWLEMYKNTIDQKPKALSGVLGWADRGSWNSQL
jgi:hypothetical protein